MACRMLRVAEVTDRLSCSERTVRRWIADGTLPSTKIKGLRLVPEAALDRLIGGGDPAWLDAENTEEIPDERALSGVGFDIGSTAKSGEGK
jgi:excisionase family DNA binding protein